jgi:hypothetical protein
VLLSAWRRMSAQPGTVSCAAISGTISHDTRPPVIQ